MSAPGPLGPWLAGGTTLRDGDYLTHVTRRTSPSHVATITQCGVIGFEEAAEVAAVMAAGHTLLVVLRMLEADLEAGRSLIGSDEARLKLIREAIAAAAVPRAPR